jgi:DNA-directed RNA polymerase specialized sigma24 family protein
MSDFEKLEELSGWRELADQRWREEIRSVYAKGHGLRTIAKHAGVSHGTVHSITRDPS